MKMIFFYTGFLILIIGALNGLPEETHVPTATTAFGSGIVHRF
ncbi:MAG: hypothetical protein QXX56_03795 [Candidatus Bathyarchaeia archaeon]